MEATRFSANNSGLSVVIYPGDNKILIAMSVNGRNGKLVASFPVEDSDQIMLVTDKGQLIRCPVGGIRIAGRSTQGVIVFDTAQDEHVVSVEHIGEDTENGNGNENGNGG